jgi:hypothetical protein
MINKKVFEDDLIAGMQQELRKQASAEQPDLVKAGECLHAALDILEEVGLQSSADQVLGILTKIAIGHSSKHIQKMPSLQMLIENGMTPEDLKAFGKGDKGAMAKMNAVLRKMGLGDAEIAQLIGKHNLVPEHEAKTYEKFMGWMQDPTTLDEGPAQPGQTVDIKSLAAKPRQPKRPDKVNDYHTKNLTPEKMIENLKHHGTEFNMAKDGIVADISNANFDPELAEALDTNNADDLEVDDIFDAKVIDDTLEVSDQEPLDDFEDEVSHADDHKSTEKLIKIIENHGHKAWFHNGKLYAAENAGAKHTELPANIKAVKEWLGY